MSPPDRWRTMLGVMAAAAVLAGAWLLRDGAPRRRTAAPRVDVTPPAPAPTEVAPIPAALPSAPDTAAPPPESKEESKEAPQPDSPEPRGLPLRLVFRDAISGRALTVRSVSLGSGGGPEEKLSGWTPDPAVGEAEGHLFSRTPIFPDADLDLRVSAVLPDGFVAGRGEPMGLGGVLSAFAERIEAVVPLWPEARLRLVAMEEDGSPAAGAEVKWGTVAGSTLEVRAETTDARGETLVRGIPFLRGEAVVVAATLDGRAAASAPATLRDLTEEVVARVILPRQAQGVGVGGGAGGMFGGRRAGRRTLTLGETGSLRVKVLRRDGRAANGVEVRSGSFARMTASDGTARFSGVPTGEREARVVAPGFHTDAGTVEVLAGKEAYLELKEAAGRTVEVLVLDDEGRAVAGATLRVTCEGGVAWCHMDGATQVIGIHTGPDGRRALPGIPAGPVSVTATFGSRRAEVAAGSADLLEIRLPPVR